MKNHLLEQLDLAAIHAHLKAESKEPWTWLFYGDSITHGATHTHGWRSFPEIFAERIRWELQHRLDVVINTGISGNTSDDLLREYDWRCRHWQPDAVFLLIGTNDIVKIDNICLYRQNLKELVHRLREDHAIPVIQTYPPVQKVPDNDAYLKRLREMPAYNDVIREVAAEESVVLVDHDRAWRPFASDPAALAELLGEPIHPGALGHLEMAGEIFRTFGIYDPAAPGNNPAGTPMSIAPFYEK